MVPGRKCGQGSQSKHPPRPEALRRHLVRPRASALPALTSWLLRRKFSGETLESVRHWEARAYCVADIQATSV
eukprot:353414-Chlamydomonas_euryale.AAC.17